MSVRVRLTRVGSKKNPIWRVVVADQRSPRDGRSIETLGHYNPQTQPSTIVIDRERLDYWLERGAQPSGTVKKLMRAPNTEVAVRAARAGRGGHRDRRRGEAEAPADVAAAAEPEVAEAPAEPEAAAPPRPPPRRPTSEPDPEAPAEDAPAEPEAAETGSEPDPEAPSTESA